MKKIFVAAAVAALVAGGAAVAMANVATGTGISTKGSAHNFADNIKNNNAAVSETGAGGWNSKRAEICRVCHTPHDHANSFASQGPLWNRSSSSVNYTPYDSASLDATDVGQPNGNSKLCLSCHDGSLALDTFDKYSAPGTAGLDLTGAGYSNGFQVPNFGKDNTAAGDNTDLTGTHPISFVYNTALATLDGSLHDPETATFIQGAANNEVKKFLGAGGTLECSTCHDVHDSPGNVIVGTHLLRAPMKGDTGNSNGKASALCLSCHNK